MEVMKNFEYAPEKYFRANADNANSVKPFASFLLTSGGHAHKSN